MIIAGLIFLKSLIISFKTIKKNIRGCPKSNVLVISKKSSTEKSHQKGDLP